MAKRTTILKVSGLRRAFGPNTIFDKFSLEVRTGEAIALTGRNGAGKSTLLRCLVGADRPDDGNVQVCGNPMSETSPEIRRDVATVIDDLDFFPDLSVVEHLDLLARAHGIADPDEVVDEVLEEVQLVPQSGQLPGTLSSGQRRRLALATAFVRPRKLLILDEPEQRLDTEGRDLAGTTAEVGATEGSGDRLRQPRAGAGRQRRHPGGTARSTARMSSLEAGADDFAYHEAPEPRALTPASPRELKRLIKDWRAGRATRNVLQAMSDAYVAVFAAVMIGAMVVNVILKAQRTIAQCTSASCLSARAILPWAAFAAIVAIALAASRLFGPVLASAAEGFWLLDAPISRAKLLRSRLVGAVLAAFLGGAVVGALVSALTGSGLVEVLVWVGGHGTFGCRIGRLRCRTAGRRAARPDAPGDLRLRVTGRRCALQCGGGRGRVVQRWACSDNVGIELGVIMIVASALVLLVSGVLAALRLGQIRRARLLSGGALVSGISGAFFALDIGLARDIVVERRAIERGHVHPRRGKGLGLEALIWREWQRLWRFPQPLLVLAGTIVVPYAADALGHEYAHPGLCGTRPLRRNHPAARRAPGADAYRWVGSLLALLSRPHQTRLDRRACDLGRRSGPWRPLRRTSGSATEPSSGTVPEASMMAIATAAAGLLAAVRWTQAKGVDFGAPMVASQAGAFPPGLVTNLFRGFDVCLLTTAPMLLGLLAVLVAG